MKKLETSSRGEETSSSRNTLLLYAPPLLSASLGGGLPVRGFWPWRPSVATPAVRPMGGRHRGPPAARPLGARVGQR